MIEITECNICYHDGTKKPYILSNQRYLELKEQLEEDLIREKNSKVISQGNGWTVCEVVE